MRFLLVTMVLLSLSHAVMSDAQTVKPVLSFAINAPGSAPYIYFDKVTDSYQGVVVDFFASFDANSDVNVIYIDSSRARNEQRLLSDKADLFLSGLPWLEKPERFILSDALMPHNSYIYATRPFQQPFVPGTNNRKLICTRYGFVYPVLSAYFESYRLVRVDSTTQTTMAQMLAKNRCNFAIMSDDNARAIMSKKEFCDTAFYQSPNVISAVDVVMVLRPELVEVKAKIDAQLARFIHSGERDKSVRRHVGGQVFPKARCFDSSG